MTGLAVDVQYAAGGAPAPAAEPISAWARAAFAAQSRFSPDPARAIELAIRVVGRDEMQMLNQRYRGKPAPTNVLSFPADALPEAGIEPLGDIAICAEVVAEEARQQGVEPVRRWAHMVVHGVLHLCGYDHLHEPEAVEMERLEAAILGTLEPFKPFI